MGGAAVFHAIPDVLSSTIFLVGEFDEDGTDDFSRALKLLELLGAPRIAIDMSDLTYLGSAGLGCLIRAQRGGREIVLHGVRPPQLRVLEVTALDAVFQITDDDRAVARP